MTEEQIKARAENLKKKVHEYYERYRKGEQLEVAQELGGLTISTNHRFRNLDRKRGDDVFERYGESLMKAIAEKVISGSWEYTVMSVIGSEPELIILGYRSQEDFSWMGKR